MYFSSKASFFASLLIIVTMIFACEGPQGPQGPAGPEGPQGDQGPQGEEGNANVTSDSVTVTDSDWQQGWFEYQTGNSQVSRPALVDTLEVSALTESIYKSGMVIVYFKNVDPDFGVSKEWIELPFEFLSFNNEFYYNMRYTYQAGQIELFYFFTPNSSGNTVPELDNFTVPDYRFKWVVASSAAAGKMKQTDIDLSNHDEVMKYLKKNYQQGDGYIIRQN